MQTIHVLPPDIVAEIAAGEVIERPAYVVKELIENALDAQATVISISLSGYGLGNITVRDNGIGMSKEDIALCVHLHATSKTNSKENLWAVRTYGFRGEALASIATVAELVIKSKENKTHKGYQVTVSFGSLALTKTIALSQGTIISVDRLFEKHPARKKFLKSNQTELKHIVDIVTGIALVRPDVTFELSHNKKMILSVSAEPTIKKQTLKPSRIEALMGKTISQNLFSVYYENSYITVQGFICHPQQTFSSRNKIYTFVNARTVDDTLISTAIREAYSSLIPTDQFPIAFVSISLPYQYVDVNIHPRKEQIKFVDERFMFDTVYQAITDSLHKQDILYKAGWEMAVTGKKLTKSVAGLQLKNDILTTPAHPDTLTQLYNTYILVPDPQQLILVDQHAAHERILYEKLKCRFSQIKQNDTYHLHPAVTFAVSVSEKLIIDEYQTVFEELGFVIEPFGAHDIKVSKVPSIFKDRNPQELLSDMLADLGKTGKIKSIDTASHKMLTYLSCRAAVKAGDTLTPIQMHEILVQLADIPTAITCPHGRPIKISITKAELEKVFGRR